MLENSPLDEIESISVNKKDVASLTNYADKKLLEINELSEVMSAVPSIVQRGGIYLVTATVGFSAILLYFGKVPVWVDAEGNIVSENENIEVRAKENGVVTEVLAKVGQRLPKNATLLQIKPESSNQNTISSTEELKILQNLQEKELEIVQNKLELAQLEQLKYQSNINKEEQQKKSINHRDYIDNLTKQIESIQAEIQEIKAQINYGNKLIKNIQTPQGGKIVQLEVKNPGIFISKGTLVAEVIPTENRFIVKANIPERDFSAIQPGMEAQIKIDAYNYHQYGRIPAKVNRIEPDLQQPGNFIMTLDLLKNNQEKMKKKLPDMTIFPGLNVQVEIKTKELRLYQLLFSK